MDALEHSSIGPSEADMHSRRRRPSIGTSLLFVLSLLAMGCLSEPPGCFALTKEEANTIAIYEKVAPSVVNITTILCDTEFFFCVVPQSGSGSGIVLKEDGTIVTNHHVIEDSSNIQVTLSDGRRMEAEVVGKAQYDDLSIIKVDVGDKPLKAITLGDSGELRVGEKVLALGNPFGLGQTLTVGSVSSTHRDIKDNGHVFRNLIQTDASINPGNSGGALVNSQGELVGICTVILSPTGASVGIGFAIPVNRVKEVVPGIMHNWGKWMGWIIVIVLVYWILRRIYVFR